MFRAHRFFSTAAVLIASALASCSKQPAGADKESVIFSAAASTKEITESLAEQFKAKHAVEVKINLGPSSGLANQIVSGAPADLFLSANQQWAEEVQKAGQAETSVRLLTNRLAIIVPKNNPADVHEPKDLLSSKVKAIALAGEKVPAGLYAGQSLEKLGLRQQLIEERKIVRGSDVRTALGYVERGEAEAGIVYSTDVGSTSDVKSVYEFDPKLHDEIVYVLVLLKHADGNPTARQLYEFLQSEQANKVYSQFGFTRLP